MHQAPIQAWNEIAQSQALSQPWATLFRMTQQELPAGLEKLVDGPLEAQGADNKTVLAYRLVAPLLMENEAISDYLLLANSPSLRASLPELTSVNQAVILASQEYRLNPSQQAKLTQLLTSALQG